MRSVNLLPVAQRTTPLTSVWSINSSCFRARATKPAWSTVVHVSWVVYVLYRSCTTFENHWLGCMIQIIICPTCEQSNHCTTCCLRRTVVLCSTFFRVGKNEAQRQPPIQGLTANIFNNQKAISSRSSSMKSTTNWNMHHYSYSWQNGFRFFPCACFSDTW